MRLNSALSYTDKREKGVNEQRSPDIQSSRSKSLYKSSGDNTSENLRDREEYTSDGSDGLDEAETKGDGRVLFEWEAIWPSIIAARSWILSDVRLPCDELMW